MDRKRNRNAIRSKKLIRQAFIEMLRERPFEKITVTDLVEKADVNRSTFYAHYPDVMGIVEEIEKDILESIVKPLNEMEFDDFWEEPEKYIKITIQSLEKNCELYRLLSTSNVASRQLEKVKEILVRKITKTMVAWNQEISQDEYEYLIRFLVGGMMEIYTQWIHGNIKGSLDDVTDKMTRLVVCVSKEIILK